MGITGGLKVSIEALNTIVAASPRTIRSLEQGRRRNTGSVFCDVCSKAHDHLTQARQGGGATVAIGSNRSSPPRRLLWPRGAKVILGVEHDPVRRPGASIGSPDTATAAPSSIDWQLGVDSHCNVRVARISGTSFTV